MTLVALMSLALLTAALVSGAGPSWQPLYEAYARHFLDRQIRVIDRDAADRTTSEAQAYAMFFALVANDRPRFDALLGWTEKNLASGDLATHLPAWLWGRNRRNRWGVLDANSASDADVWMAYSLLEAGQAWNEPRYTSLGRSLVSLIARDEVVEIPGVGVVLMPAPKGFRHGADSYRLNVSYMPLQLFIRLDRLLPGGPWRAMADRIPALVKASSPQGFASDWLEFSPDKGFMASGIGSYDAVRVYLWAGLLDPSTPGRDAILSALPGMTTWLRSHAAPPEKVKSDGTVANPRGPVGFSAALLPFLSAISEKQLELTQLARVRSAFDPKTSLYGRPARYYDQNLTLFALGWMERRFWFDSSGALKLWWRETAER
jgi:endo-1,4-beta-D-glucanase Y